MLLLAFDFYDSNNDGLISQFDLFKVMYFYNSRHSQESVQRDTITMSKVIAKDQTSGHFRNLIQ
jgi:Ca2+-binding EF-hand superfamily protein